MFTIEHIKTAHSKVKSGADFPGYIREIKQLGVIAFKTWVKDSHTEYFGKDDYSEKSAPMHKSLANIGTSDKEKFSHYLKIHQQGETDYFTFCEHCAETGVENWFADLDKMICTYFDNEGKEILIENIPG